MNIFNVFIFIFIFYYYYIIVIKLVEHSYFYEIVVM